MTFLLAITYLAFISLGLPDAMLGSAWPSMHLQLQVPVSCAGMISMVISIGTVISSLLSDRITRKWGTGLVTAVSVGLTAAALLGFSVAPSFWALCLLAIPYGLGAGAVDAALNNYAAIHFKASHMSWLHCCWGVGASLGPYIMGACLTGGLTWNSGYRIVGFLQIALTAFLFASLSAWKEKRREGEKETKGKPKTEGEPKAEALKATEDTAPSVKQLLGISGVKAEMAAFFFYCALEQTAGLWGASYMVMARGMAEKTAAKWAALFYLGITAGRFASGFLAIKLNDKAMVRQGQIVGLIGILLVIAPLGNFLMCLGLIVIGLGCAPVYPSLMHQTPKNFGEELSQAIVGLQMAFAYLGITLMPPLFGLIAQHISIRWYPIYLLILLGAMFLSSEELNRRASRADSLLY